MDPSHQHFPQEHEHERRPSVTSNSDTPAASSDVSSSSFPFPTLPDSSLATGPASRNTRNLVIDSSIARPPPGAQLIRRKPLSSSASPIATRYSSGEYLTIARGLPRPEQRYSRSFSVDSPTVYDFQTAKVQAVTGLQSTAVKVAPPIKEIDIGNSPGIQDSNPPSPMTPEPAVIAGEVKHPFLADPQEDHNPAAPQTELAAGLSQHGKQDSAEAQADTAAAADADEDPLSVLDGYNTDSSYNSNSHNSNMSLNVARKPGPPHLSLVPVDTDTDTSTSASHHDVVKTPNTDKPLPKSPGSASKLGNFFGWGSPSPASPEFSDKGFSPISSQYGFSKSNTFPDASPATLRQSSHLEAPRASSFGSGNSRDYCDSYLATPPAISPAASAQIDEMEDELKAISTELAASIRREMDLEDLVDRYQAERDNPTTTGSKRTSDYFSDSGYSSAKFSDYDQSREEIEKIQRRSEQEKAQLRLELTTKVQDERAKRQQLDDQIKELSVRASQIDTAQMNNMDATGRVKELEATCETLRRKLSEERQVKDNFEDLLSALRGELQNAANERDNLRDEIVPQLRARVEGLEGQASELEKMNYESTKMQQQLQALQVENDSLRQAKAMSSIAEDSTSQSNSQVNSRRSSLARSNSITGPPSAFKMSRAPAGLTRSKSVKTTESREALSDRLKDVEEQRDALHRALKALLERQECQNRENEKKIRSLEVERDRLLTSSPQKAGFAREVSHLREEINVLRRRSEEALEQKWQVEKGLAGLKMDLDRAEQEIASLRSLLQEKDILIPEAFARSSGSSDGRPSVPVTSESLTTAYADLQAAYTSALGRVKQLELGSSPQDEKTMLAMQKLEQSLQSVVSERDILLQDASSYKTQLAALKAGEKNYLESEKVLSDELSESARRVEELATQVRQQLSNNQNLRQRLADTVARGDAAQKANAERITAMQARLRTLEDQVIAAQTASDERVARHEEEISTLKESHNQQLSRLSGNLRSPRTFPPKSPMSPLFAGSSARSPRLSSTRSGPAMSVADETQVASLRAKVLELERALTQADADMEEVVGRMNSAQIEVLQLQEEREAAMSQTRRLERELQAEKVKAFEDRFKSLQV
ncbi:hypothetical protein JX266_007043 [Neoarthrinium moseri]|nr:hypothetical protein JX266_007043 [Neoarthrinium moseri]